MFSLRAATIRYVVPTFGRWVYTVRTQLDRFGDWSTWLCYGDVGARGAVLASTTIVDCAARRVTIRTRGCRWTRLLWMPWDIVYGKVLSRRLPPSTPSCGDVKFGVYEFVVSPGGKRRGIICVNKDVDETVALTRFRHAAATTTPTRSLAAIVGNIDVSDFIERFASSFQGRQGTPTLSQLLLLMYVVGVIDVRAFVSFVCVPNGSVGLHIIDLRDLSSTSMMTLDSPVTLPPA